MTFSVLVQSSNGQFTAELVGAPEVRAKAATRAEAVAALQAVIEQRVAKGELIGLEIGHRGVSLLAGKSRADTTLREICEEAYQQRNSEPVE